MIFRVKGTHDLLDTQLYDFLLDAAKQHVVSYHFETIYTPLIEHVDLFKRSLGDYTDVVSKEMFIIQTAGGEQLCLRPEMTASMVRAFLENSIQTTPWRVFSFGPVFRYERPQKGRCRQFHQMNFELLGAESVMYDVELIVMLDRLFHERLRINNYALLINYLGCADDRITYRNQLQAQLYELGDQICATCQVRREKNPLRVFDCKNAQCQELYNHVALITDFLCGDCQQEWRDLQESLSLLSVSYVHNPRLVRGLDYYNKTAFEFVSNNLGAQNAFCGGGRYDSLVSQFDASRSVPAIGAAIGIERLLLLLEPYKEMLQLPNKSVVHAIIPLSKKQAMLALFIADTLRAHNVSVEVLLDEGSIKSLFRKVDKMGATWALIIGEDEQKENTVMVKNMITGAQEKVHQIDLIGYLTR